VAEGEGRTDNKKELKLKTEARKRENKITKTEKKHNDLFVF